MAHAPNGLETALYPFITVLGGMTFAAAIALLVTLATRSILVGALVGVAALPVMGALRFKETAPYDFYLHLENVQAYLSGQPTTVLRRVYEFDMSVLSSAWILAVEMTVLLVASYLVFRRQEIVY